MAAKGGLWIAAYGCTPTYQVEPSNLLFVALKNFLLVQNCEGVLEQAELSVIIGWRVGCHRWRRVNLDQPRPQLIVKQNVETVQLKTVLVVNYNLLNGLQALDDQVIHFAECVCDLLYAVLRHQKELY